MGFTASKTYVPQQKLDKVPKTGNTMTGPG